MNRSRIKAIVNEILEQEGMRLLPIDLNKIAKLANAEVRTDTLKEGLSGFAYQENETRLIGISSSDGRLRRRFTLAHELGHIYLHKKDSVSFDVGLMMLRNDHSSDGTDIKEIEANRFAAELLMPEEEVRRDMQGAPKIDFLSDEKETQLYIKTLAKKYDVSPKAMGVRIATLYFN